MILKDILAVGKAAQLKGFEQVLTKPNEPRYEKTGFL